MSRTNKELLWHVMACAAIAAWVAVVYTTESEGASVNSSLVVDDAYIQGDSEFRDQVIVAATPSLSGSGLPLEGAMSLIYGVTNPATGAYLAVYDDIDNVSLFYVFGNRAGFGVDLRVVDIVASGSIRGKISIEAPLEIAAVSGTKVARFTYDVSGSAGALENAPFYSFVRDQSSRSLVAQSAHAFTYVDSATPGFGTDINANFSTTSARPAYGVRSDITISNRAGVDGDGVAFYGQVDVNSATSSADATAFWAASIDAVSGTEYAFRNTAEADYAFHNSATTAIVHTSGALVVAGTSAFTGVLTAGRITAATVVATTASITSVSISGNLTVGGSVNIAGTLGTVDADTVDTLHASATVTAGKLLAVDASGDFVMGAGGISGASATVAGATVTGNLYVSGTSKFVGISGESIFAGSDEEYLNGGGGIVFAGPIGMASRERHWEISINNGENFQILSPVVSGAGQASYVLAKDKTATSSFLHWFTNGLKISGDSLDIFTCDDAATFNDTVTMATTVTITGDASVGGTLLVTGDAVLSGDLDVTDDFTSGTEFYVDTVNRGVSVGTPFSGNYIFNVAQDSGDARLAAFSGANTSRLRMRIANDDSTAVTTQTLDIMLIPGIVTDEGADAPKIRAYKTGDGSTVADRDYGIQFWVTENDSGIRSATVAPNGDWSFRNPASFATIVATSASITNASFAGNIDVVGQVRGASGVFGTGTTRIGNNIVVSGANGYISAASASITNASFQNVDVAGIITLGGTVATLNATTIVAASASITNASIANNLDVGAMISGCVKKAHYWTPESIKNISASAGNLFGSPTYPYYSFGATGGSKVAWSHELHKNYSTLGNPEVEFFATMASAGSAGEKARIELTINELTPNSAIVSGATTHQIFADYVVPATADYMFSFEIPIADFSASANGESVIWYELNRNGAHVNDNRGGALRILGVEIHWFENIDLNSQMN